MTDMPSETGRRAPREITGRHVLAVTVGAFGLIIAVNVLMAVKAVSTFPGLEVKNSYVASPSFEARRDAQDALGWTAEAGIEDGVLRVRFTGADGLPLRPATVSALLGRTTNASDDQTPELRVAGDGYAAEVHDGRGLWTLKLTATSEGGTLFEKRFALTVR